MGQLIAVPDFRARNPNNTDKSRPLNDSFWYFNDTIDHFQSDFDVSKTYPETLYIHADWIKGVSYHYAGNIGLKVEDAGRLRVEIREWIEQNVSNVVIYDCINLNYYRAVPPKKIDGKVERGYEHDVRHAYYAFYFKNSAEATHFKLRFAGFVSNAMSSRHPDRPREDGVYDVREYHVATAISSPYGGITDPQRYEL